MKTIIVLPTYNECDNLRATIQSIFATVPTDLSVIVVDDSSPDGTGAVADIISTDKPTQVSVLHRKGRRGLGSAYIEGFRLALAAGAEVVCEMDADGSHDASALSALLEAVRAGAGVAVGSRRVAGGKIIGWGPHRHFMSFCATELARAVLGLQTRDVTSGYRAYSREVVTNILESDVKSNGYAFQEETLFQAERSGYPIVEIPITFRDRQVGESKLSWREVPEYFRTIFRLRTRFKKLKH